jgi:hypothetical protein
MMLIHHVIMVVGRAGSDERPPARGPEGRMVVRPLGMSAFPDDAFMSWGGRKRGCCCSRQQGPWQRLNLSYKAGGGHHHPTTSFSPTKQGPERPDCPLPQERHRTIKDYNTRRSRAGAGAATQVLIQAGGFDKQGLSPIGPPPAKRTRPLL